MLNACSPQSGGSAAIRALFRPHCPHFSRRRAASRLPPPAAITQSKAVKVRADPQPPQVTLTLQPNDRS